MNQARAVGAASAIVRHPDWTAEYSSGLERPWALWLLEEREAVPTSLDGGETGDRSERSGSSAHVHYIASLNLGWPSIA